MRRVITKSGFMRSLPVDRGSARRQWLELIPEGGLERYQPFLGGDNVHMHHAERHGVHVGSTVPFPQIHGGAVAPAFGAPVYAFTSAAFAFAKEFHDAGTFLSAGRAGTASEVPFGTAKGAV